MFGLVLNCAALVAQLWIAIEFGWSTPRVFLVCWIAMLVVVQFVITWRRAK